VKKNFALAIALSIAITATAPAFAYTRDGGTGRDRDFNPITRVINILKKLFKPATEDGITEPHP
jgi:hypothetical protein